MKWRYVLIAAAAILAAGAWWLWPRPADTSSGIVQVEASEPPNVAAPEVPPLLPEPTSPPEQVPRLPPEVGAAVVDGWAGRWDGVDGRFMDIARDPAAGSGHYRVTMRYGREQKQDGFLAVATGESIIVDRPEGKVMFNRGSGKDAGDRRLFERRDCLVEESGEGYCRN